MRAEARLVNDLDEIVATLQSLKIPIVVPILEQAREYLSRTGNARQLLSARGADAQPALEAGGLRGRPVILS